MPSHRVPAGGKRVPAWSDRRGWELLLSGWCAARVDGGETAPLGRAAAAALAVVAMLRIPAVRADLGTGAEAEAVRGALANPARSGGALARSVNAVLRVPHEAGEYRIGHDRQTLRRKARAAERLGVRWRPVDAIEERLALVEIARERERGHPMPQHRYDDPQLADLPEHRLWLLAVDASDRPLVLSVTPFDGRWAALRYFRALEDGEAASTARYLLTEVLVDRLAERGVRYLADSRSPFDLPSGLREFQRMLGWRLMRVTLRSHVDG